MLALFIWGVFCANCIAQGATHNFGNFKIHNNGTIGFHDDLINDGITDDNEGLAGFYNTQNLTISGAFRPIFEDIEILVADNLFLEVGIGITNNGNFILGDVITPRNQLDITLDFINTAFYTGETNSTKINGYSSITNKQNFNFPLGEFDKLRPLELFSENINALAKSAYFFEDPNFPSTFSSGFNTSTKTDILTSISSYEFWDLDAAIPSRIQIQWDTDSNLGEFVDEIENLRIVGWNTQNQIWENLGGNSITGDFDAGAISSDTFIPDDYTVISFGSSLSANNLSLDNYLLTPDGDGTNDFLHFEAISLSPTNNSLTVFNRWGRLVYSANGYQNNFEGISDNSFTIAPNTKLPDGVYFYILKLDDINLIHQGFLAISN